MTHRTPAQGRKLRGEIQRRLLAGEAIKCAAADLGITPTYLARVAEQIGLTRPWLTRAEAAQVNAHRALALRCPECQRTSAPHTLRTHELGPFGTFHECPRCTIGSVAAQWKPAAGLAPTQ